MFCEFSILSRCIRNLWISNRQWSCGNKQPRYLLTNSNSTCSSTCRTCFLQLQLVTRWFTQLAHGLRMMAELSRFLSHMLRESHTDRNGSQCRGAFYTNHESPTGFHTMQGGHFIPIMNPHRISYNAGGPFYTNHESPTGFHTESEGQINTP
jgi:hypothetical protein